MQDINGTKVISRFGPHDQVSYDINQFISSFYVYNCYSLAESVNIAVFDEA